MNTVNQATTQPVNKIERYLHAATRDNTRQSYQSAVEHFEVNWGGCLPATSEQIARYLSDYAETLSFNTLKQRLVGIGQWHAHQGFPDPTKTPYVKKVLKGIAEEHPYTEKQAKPLHLEELKHVVSWLEQKLLSAQSQNNQQQSLLFKRNKALLLIGFWRGFRSDELSGLQIENISVSPGTGMDIKILKSKTDRSSHGRHMRAPALSQMCPVDAYQDWLSSLNYQQGPVFRGISRWGVVSSTGLHPDSIAVILKKLLKEAGIENYLEYSSHSLRRGFATWANNQQWDIKSLMEYVGWKDVNSAMRYIEAPDLYGQQKIEQGLRSTLPGQEAPKELEPSVAELKVKCVLQKYHKGVRSLKQVRERLEQYSLKPLGMTHGSQIGEYFISIAYRDNDHLNEQVDDLLHELYESAADQQCLLEANIQDIKTKKMWS